MTRLGDDDIEVNDGLEGQLRRPVLPFLYLFRNRVGHPGDKSAANSGLTDIDVYSLLISGKDIFAGTNGRGVWKRPSD